jgi:serine/threonine protein kinase
MSPEQLLGDPVDARSDIYSLGCILYQMLTGRRSFDEPTREQMIKRRLTERAPHPRDLVPELPKTLDLIVARMLARAPQDRYGTVAEVRDLLIPAIALEGGFDDPSWRPPTTRSNPTVFIQAAEQPTQEMTPYPGVSVQRPVWMSQRVIGAAAVAVVAVGIMATMITRNVLSARESERQARIIEEARVNKPTTPSVIVVPQPTAAPLPKSTAPIVSRNADTGQPGAARSVVAATTVSPELQQPIEQLKAAIESRLPSKMEEVYRSYEQDDQTKKYFKAILDKADSVHVKSIIFQNSNVIRNVAQVNYRMIINVITNQSKIPTEVPSSWRADLVRKGPKQPWELRQLTRHVVM